MAELVQGFDQTEPDWRRLSATSGVDLLAIRNKYQRMKSEGLTHKGMGVGAGAVPGLPADYGAVTPLDRGTSTASDEPPVPFVDPDEARAAQERVERLDMIHVCHICNGTGIETYVYNHMSRQRNCEACDGEGTIKKAGVGVAVPVDMPAPGQPTESTPAPPQSASASTADNAPPGSVIDTENLFENAAKHAATAAKSSSDHAANPYEEAAPTAGSSVAIELDDEEDEEGEEAGGGQASAGGPTSIPITMEDESDEEDADVPAAV